MNNGIINFLNIVVSIIEINIIIKSDKKVNIKCLEKRSNNLYLDVRQLMMRLKKMKKINQEKTKL